MRVQYISISRWRHFDNIELAIPPDASVVSLVGGNGTGKSQILELIAACAERIGISHGFEFARGNPFGEDAQFQVRFHIAAGAVGPTDPCDPTAPMPDDLKEAHKAWDRTLTVSRDPELQELTAGGVPPELQSSFVDWAKTLIRNSTSTHYLILDADRSYPQINVGTHEIGGAFETNWDTQRKSRSFALTKSLYEEWFRYLLGTENKETAAFVANIRRAREKGKREPKFIDRLTGYRDAVKTVLPHLLFTGVDTQSRNVEFDSTGLPLKFYQLSGGEREIAFLIGQIERFGLKKGLLLVDEPELHLNYDLLRAWIGFLKSSIEVGQVWLATHSLEVVEVAGPDSSFLLERDVVSRKVNRATSLVDRPIISTLSRSVGSPAFSISALTFLIIEGTEEIGERERFRNLTHSSSNVRFIEGGGCPEVLRRLETLKLMAKASGETMRLGAILDRDWRDAGDVTRIRAKGVHVLKVHEAENFFLHPLTMKEFMNGLGLNGEDYDNLLQSLCDVRAGIAIFEAARCSRQCAEFPAPTSAARKLAHDSKWDAFADIDKAAKSLAAADAGLDETQQSLLEKVIRSRAKIFERERAGDDLWKKCEGKEVLNGLAGKLGLSNAKMIERAIFRLWKSKPELVPDELIQLRHYVASFETG